MSSQAKAREQSARSTRRWGRWLLGATVTLVVCAVGAFSALHRDIVSHGAPSFHRAIARGDVLTVRLYILAGFDPTARWATPVLNPAAENGRIEMIAFLIARGADVNAHRKDGGNSPLEVAIRHRQFESVRFLLEHGASPNPLIRGEDHPLRIAASECLPEVFRLLRRHGALLVDGSPNWMAVSREELSRSSCAEIVTEPNAPDER